MVWYNSRKLNPLEIAINFQQPNEGVHFAQMADWLQNPANFLSYLNALYQCGI